MSVEIINLLLIVIIIILFTIKYKSHKVIIDNFDCDESVGYFRKCYRKFPNCIGKAGKDWAWYGSQCPGYNWSNRKKWEKKLCKPVDCSRKNYAYICPTEEEEY